jgi:serine-type D-Ala-D-Ala endopeptidase (penicillin-binding protein 7)
MRRRIRQGFVVMALLGAFVVPQAQAASPGPERVAEAKEYARLQNEFSAALVMDANTGKVLYSYKPDLAWPAASLTKLMSALVLLDQKISWNKTVSLLSKDEVGGGRLRVVSGSKMSMRDMFYSSIVGSANNTTMALARLSGLGLSGFVKAMNKKAAALGLKQTSFVDPSGIEVGNTTTAEEMAKLARHAFAQDMIRRAASTAVYEFPIRNSKVMKKITNTNKLLTSDDEMYVYGGKTGFIYESMYNLVVKVSPNPRAVSSPPLIVVVFGAPTSNDSFKAAKSLAKWAWNAYDWPSTRQVATTP